MKKTNRVILCLCLIILVCVISIVLKSRQYQHRMSEAGTANLGPLFNAVHGEDYDTVEKLVKLRPEILKERHTLGGTYINCAASSKDVKMMKLLLDLGGDPNTSALCGMTPLILASGNNDPAMVKVLLEAGANPNAFGDNSCPLTKAKQTNSKEVIELLLKYGAREITPPAGAPIENRATP